MTVPFGHAVITGGMGFIGGHLARSLVAQDVSVTLLDDLSTGRFENVADIADDPRVQIVEMDILDQQELEPFIAKTDMVFHLAAALGVHYVTERPVETVHSNVAGTESVLGAAHMHGKRVLVTSTSEVYGKGSKLPFSEDDDVVLGATSRSRWCYAASKMLDEFLALGYHQQYGLPVTAVRLFNTVGPRQAGRYGMVVPNFVRAAIEGSTIEVYGDGEQSRCFLHVHDCVRALIALASSDDTIGQVYNIGSTEPVTITELAFRVLERAKKRVGNSGVSIDYVSYEKAYGPGFEDMRRRVPDITKIHNAVGWSPTIGLDAILDDVIDDLRETQALVA